MGLPSGTMWARSNIDITQPNGFAESGIQQGASYFSWGNVDGHNANEGSFSPFNWGNDNGVEPYVSSPGAAIAYPGSLDIAHDCAREVCGAPWQVPKSSDFIELQNNCDYVDANGDIISGADKIITIDGVVGIRMRSKINGNIIFFAACGLGDGLTLRHANEWGQYWFSSLKTQPDASALSFNSSSVTVSSSIKRYHGCTVRPIFRM